MFKFFVLKMKKYLVFCTGSKDGIMIFGQNFPSLDMVKQSEMLLEGRDFEWTEESTAYKSFLYFSVPYF